MRCRLLAACLAAAVLAALLSTPASGGGDPLLEGLERVSANLAYVEGRRAEVAAELAACDLELARACWRLAWRRRQLAALVRVLYELGPEGPLDLLLGSRNFRELGCRAETLVLLGERLSGLAREAGEEAALLERRRAELEEVRARLEEAGAALEARRDELRARLIALAALSGGLGRLVASEQAVRALPARRLEMLPPVDGPVSSGYGPRVHPLAGVPEFHAGVDLAVPEGVPVRAAESGLVVVSGPVGDYGLVVVVDHGGGVATVYAHLLRCLAGPGEVVARGAAVGLAGSTGLSTGPHLHFEVRVWGRPQDPGEWLRGR